MHQFSEPLLAFEVLDAIIRMEKKRDIEVLTNTGYLQDELKFLQLSIQVFN